MPRYSARRRNRAAILRIVLIPLLALVAIVLLLFNEHNFSRKLATFTAITAVAKDTRIRPIARFAVEYGSNPLYEVDILVDYTQNGAQHEEWLVLSEAPHSQAKAQDEATAVKGHAVTVRWNPSTPDQKIVSREP